MTKKCISCGTPPQPYYVDPKNSVTQDHAAIFRDTQFAAGIKIKEEFVVPALGEDVSVCADNLINLVVGSYIWNPAYGYLQIAHWDSCNKKIGLLNESISGAMLPGAVVSAGTLFAVTARPCCADQDNFQFLPFLAENYVIPGVGDAVTLAVTSTYGLIVGTNVRIGSNIYYLDQINSSLEIIVTNNGAGGTPGTLVDARDVNGDLQYLITSAVVSACTSSGVSTVKLLGCDGANQAVLEGEWAGQVPVLQDPNTEEAQYALLDTTIRVCTFLAIPVNITPGVGTYILEVGDGSIFSVSNILEVQSSSLRFEITSITGNELSVTTIPNPPAVTITLQSGEWVCLILTTEDLQDQIDAITVNLDADYLRLDGTNEASLVNNTLTLPKLQAINTDRLLGRDTASSGDVEELTVSNGIEFTGSGGIQVSSDVRVPTGSLLMFGAAAAPTGYLLCDGTVVSRVTYSALFAVIGTAYGAGDGVNTFSLPDLRQRFPLGKANSGTGAALGDTGGNIDHTHTGPSHSHAAGGLRAAIGSNPGSTENIYMDLDGAEIFNSDYRYSVGGSTLVADAVNSSSTIVRGDTASSGTGNTGAANPPFTVVNFIIKT